VLLSVTIARLICNQSVTSLLSHLYCDDVDEHLRALGWLAPMMMMMMMMMMTMKVDWFKAVGCQAGSSLNSLWSPQIALIKSCTWNRAHVSCTGSRL